MPVNSTIGKEAEKKIREWLDRPKDGYSFDRFYDQMTGYYETSRNICDFHVFKAPNSYYIESKSTWEDRFDFSLIQDHQKDGLIEKGKIDHCYGWFIILFASHQRAFKVDASDIQYLIDHGKKSLNIKKLDSWGIPYKELRTIPNNRKKLLDYVGEIEELI